MTSLREQFSLQNKKNNLNQEPTQPQENDGQNQVYYEYRYRWVIVFLMGMMFLMNGLSKFAVLPIEKQLAKAYNVSIHQGALPVVISFITFSIANFPANYIIDTRGLRVSFVIGAGMMAIGMFLYSLINFWFYFTILAAIFVAGGQPFLVNCPAKIATYWFTAQNRTFATSIMTGQLLVGIGIGFIIPGLVLGDDDNSETVQSNIFVLYAVYFIISLIAFILVCLLMRKQPPKLPSLGAKEHKISFRASFIQIKQDANLIKLFLGYSFILGSFLSFQAAINPIFILYGFSQADILIIGQIFIIAGVPSSILWSLLIKKTHKYSLITRILSLSSLVLFLVMGLCVRFVRSSFVVIFVGGLFGLVFEAIVPITYDLGCQMGFPIGQALVIGILNGGSMLITFIISLIVTSAFSFQDKGEGIWVIIIYTIIMGIGCLLYCQTVVTLKRTNTQLQSNLPKQNRINNIQLRELPSCQKQQENNRQIEQENNRQIKYNVSIKLQAFQQFVEDHRKNNQIIEDKGMEQEGSSKIIQENYDDMI